MSYGDEQAILRRHIEKRGMRKTSQRGIVLDVFLKTEKHVDVETLYNIVKQRDDSISFASVYRTLKLLCECNLAIEMKLGKGITRYEHKYNHKHHDHLVCTECGKIVEFYSKGIEKIQNQIAQKNKFVVQSHHLEIAGVCEACSS